MSGQEFNSKSHQVLYDEIHGRGWLFGSDGAGASGAVGVQEGWGALADLMDRAREATEIALANAGVVWEGDAANAMRSGVTPLAQWAADANTAGAASQMSTDNHVNAWVSAKNAMPEPVPTTSTASGVTGIPSSFTELLAGQTDQDKQEAAAQEAKAEAVRVMSIYDLESGVATVTAGQFTPPPTVAVNVAPVGASGGGDSVPVGVREWSDPAGGDGSRSGGDTAGDPRPGTASPPHGGSPTPPSGTAPSAVAPAAPPASPPAYGPVTAGPVPDQPRPGLSVVPPGSAGFGPGGTTERGHGNAGRGFGGGRGPGGAGPGAGGAGGVRGMGTGIGGPAGEPVARSGARGPGGMGMAPVGGRGQGDEDREHVAAEYLRGSHDEFWDDTPPVAPSVIGEDED